MLQNYIERALAGIVFTVLLSFSIVGQAVAGYRIGERALQELNLPRGSFSVEVVHHTPMELQSSCVADTREVAWMPDEKIFAAEVKDARGRN